MTSKPVLVWFRRDLRLADHPALSAAAATGAPVVPVFVLDDAAAGAWRAGGASRWWLHGSLEALGQAAKRLGSPLVLRHGEAATVLAKLAHEVGAEAVHCTRAYEPWAAQQEHAVRDRLAAAGVTLRRFSGSLLHEPDRLTTKAGGPFKVYTPFWRALRRAVSVPRPLAPPERLAKPKTVPESEALASWDLRPRRPDWAGGLREAWTPGELPARDALDLFLDERLADYGNLRNRPDIEGTSRLSPHLAFGEISPRQCWWAATSAGERAERADAGLETFLKELAWREFSAHLLHHFPDLPDAPFRPEFEAFPWHESPHHVRAWQKGRTGYPIVDAGMRELWHTGWMHNRVRMIVASFLIKHLLVRWQTGAAWFWDTLVDADLANNSASWQWVAGSGADAAPYFRIFNPVTQGETFDPEGAYVRRWIPEIAGLPVKVIHSPWQAPVEVLEAAGIVLGETYPKPVVDHAAARRSALEAFDVIKART